MLAKLLPGAGSARPLPIFVSSSVSRSTVALNTVTAPSGIQNGDLLIAIVYSNTTNLTITLPSGFVAIFSDLSGNGSWYIAQKIASGESGNYAFTWSTTNSSTISVLVYRNATTINTVGALTTSGAGTTVSASSITPSSRGTLCLAYLIEAGASSLSTPSGTTQRVLYTANSPVMAVYDLSNQANTATSSYSLTWTGSGVSSAIQFQVSNEINIAPTFIASATATTTSPNLTIAKPTGSGSNTTQEGDLMIAFMYGSGGATTWTGDTGWTEVLDIGITTSTRIAYKVAGASEGSNYTFTFNASGRSVTGCILTYRLAAYDVVGAVSTSSTASSITTSASQSILIASYATGSASTTMSAPPGMTSRASDNDASGPSFGVFDQIIQKGSSGSRTTTTSTGACAMLSIKPTRSL